MKSVCIVGGGPAGLVAAKTLLRTQEFRVTLYEKKDRIGGIWALDKESKDGFLPPSTPTNLSRFTVGFSDLDWRSVDYGSDATSSKPSGKTTPPLFPQAWMANRYLETYRKRYIPGDVIHCGQEVIKAERKDGSWTVSAKDINGSVKSPQFDYLIMASGFFARPRPLQINVTHATEGVKDMPVKMIHSSAFRSLDGLLPSDVDLTGRKILIFGGGNSSGETAAAVALQLSHAQWAPSSGSIASRYKDCKIIHVTPRPIYAIPPFIEYEEGSRSYVPLDFKLYDFARRPVNLGSYAGKQNQTVRDTVHGLMQSIVGSDQSDISPSLTAPKNESRGTAYVALTESYTEYVRSGLIEVVQGRVKQISGNGDTATVVLDDDKRVLGGVAAIIYATGYSPLPALDMLDDETKKVVGYDRTSLRIPMILEQWQTAVREIPDLSFLGFYEGPYWPMMEMQAMLTANRWLSGSIADRRWYEKEEDLVALRCSMQQKAPINDVPQFWFSDYLGYLEDISVVLGLQKNHREFGDREGCTSPARFLSPTTERSESDAIMDELHRLWHDCTLQGRFVARAVMRALQGSWVIDREIQSTRGSFPSGHLHGTADFYPRFPASDKDAFDLEYLYIESGTFTTVNGHTMTASRRYVYRYSETSDTLSVWFVKPDSPLEVDYLFHNLEFALPAEARKQGASVARADHLCVKDMYDTQYRFPLKGVSLLEFEVSHAVKGPDKDYVATTRYARPSK